MAEAMIRGILDASVATAKDITVGEPMAERRAQLAERYGLKATASNLDAMDGPSIAILSVKPQNLAEVMAELSLGMKKDQTVLSIVAGARMDTLQNGLKHSAILRVMPNTPAQIGAGMTVWTASSEVPQESVSAAREILRTLGEELYVEEEKLVDMATALSASGPAYVFLFIEALIDAGVHLGMTRDVARKLVLQTVLGSTKLVQDSGRHPADLKDLVASPGGTTAEALRAFERSGFNSIVLEAVVAAYDKSKELGAQH